nr:ATP-grasp domain-containing protein [Lacticaseibacillus saniviri]
MGDKAQARATMEALAVPVIPGSHALTTLADAQAAAGTLGYPVMLKAAAGGGGKGIRLLATEAALRADFPAAQGEAKAAFGDDTMYLEKVITSAKHIEVQVLRDQAGHTTIFQNATAPCNATVKRWSRRVPAPHCRLLVARICSN